MQKHLHPTNHGPSPVRFVIEGDIKGCYDAIDHHLLMERVRRRIRDRKVLRLVHAFLKTGLLLIGRVIRGGPCVELKEARRLGLIAGITERT